MFLFCSNHRMSPHASLGPAPRPARRIDPSLVIPPRPVVVRFVPARPARPGRRALRDFTGFLVLAWAAAEIALWVGGA
jgi:hypothetical protein